MFTLELGFDVGYLERLKEMIRQMPRAVTDAVEARVVPQVRTKVRQRIAIEPPVFEGKRTWTNEKQRRYVLGYVLGKDENGAIIPYVRTHRLKEGWDVLLQVGSMGVSYGVQGKTPLGRAATAGLGEQAGAMEGSVAIVLVHPWTKTRFVQGLDQQIMHQITGWPRADQIVPEIAVETQESLAIEWRQVTGDLFRQVGKPTGSGVVMLGRR